MLLVPPITKHLPTLLILMFLQAGGRKYYAKYLSLQSAKENSAATVSSLSVSSNNMDTVTSKMNFETWKDRQQNQLERSTVCSI